MSVGWGEGERAVSVRGRVGRGAEGAILGDHSLAGLGCKKSTVILDWLCDYCVLISYLTQAGSELPMLLLSCAFRPQIHSKEVFICKCCSFFLMS